MTLDIGNVLAQGTDAGNQNITNVNILSSTTHYNYDRVGVGLTTGASAHVDIWSTENIAQLAIHQSNDSFTSNLTEWYDYLGALNLKVSNTGDKISGQSWYIYTGGTNNLSVPYAGTAGYAYGAANADNATNATNASNANYAGYASYAYYMDAQSGHPSSIQGRIYYNTSDGHFYGYSAVLGGGTWVQLDN